MLEIKFAIMGDPCLAGILLLKYHYRKLKPLDISKDIVSHFSEPNTLITNCELIRKILEHALEDACFAIADFLTDLDHSKLSVCCHLKRWWIELSAIMGQMFLKVCRMFR